MVRASARRIAPVIATTCETGLALKRLCGNELVGGKLKLKTGIAESKALGLVLLESAGFNKLRRSAKVEMERSC